MHKYFIRKLFLVCVISFIFIYLGITINFSKVNAFSASNDDINEYRKNILTSIDNYRLIYSTIKTGTVLNNNKEYDLYSDDYAGAYIDTEGILNILLTEKNCEYYSNTKNVILNMIEEPNISFKYHKFSYNYLQEILNQVEEIMIQYDICSIGIDDELNKVFIEASVEKKEELTKILFEEKEFPVDSIILHYGKNLNNKLDSNVLYGGKKLFHWLDNNNRNVGTIGVNAICNETGQIGVLTNEHVAPLNSILYYMDYISVGGVSTSIEYNYLIGDCVKAYNGVDVDASFVKFENQENWELTPYSKNNTTVYDNIKLGNDTQIIQGQPVLRIGGTTGTTTGKISSANVSINTETGVKSNLFCYTNAGQSGDSGGPVYYSDGINLYLLGLHFASGSFFQSDRQGYACKISNIMSRLNVTPITNDSFETTTLPDGTVQLDTINFNPSGTFVIPSSLNGKNVSKIGSNAFLNKDKISKIIIPNSVCSVNDAAFKGCNSLTELVIPNSITSIGESAFEGCTNLESITLPSSLTSIGSNAFKGCSSLTELVIPNSVTTMGNSILSDCFDITELTIPYLNTHMGELFGLDNYLEHSNPKIKLQTLTINGGGIIPEYAFYNFYSLENIYLPNTITSIGSKAFYNGNIGSIELPESLVSIGDYAFYDCNKLTNIVIPNSVETIGNNAFEWCDELTTVEIQKDTTPITIIGVNVFNNCSELENIIVPMSKILKYKNANNWSNYSNKISYDDVAEEMYVMYVNCYTDISEDEELQSRKSIVYELNVDCVKEYNIICSTTEELVVYLYDSNMELSGIYPTYSNSNHTATFITELPLGIYYLEISYSDYQKSGSISTTISPSNGSIHYTKTTGMTSILPHLHKVSSNTYKAQFSFTPTYKTGLHKLSLSGTTSSGSNIVFGSGSISVYDNLSKITPMYQYSMLGLDNLAVSSGKEILVYLEKNETYYIDVTLSSNQYSALNLQILTYYNCEIGAADLPPYDISIMSNNKSYGSDLCEFILHDAMDFTVTIEGLTEGKFIIYQEVINEEGIISYSLVKEESFTGDFTDSFSLEAGSYYIGYIDASTSDDMNYDIMRIVVD